MLPLAAALTAVHAPPPPVGLSLAFVLLVAILFAAILAWLRAAQHAPGHVRLAQLGIAGWLVVTGGLALSGALADFWAIPPRVAFVVAPAALFCLFLALRPATGPWLDRVSGLWLVGFQMFRVAMELILWRLARAEVIPLSMTFEGRNFDVLVGLTAPFVAWLAFSKRWVSAGPVIFWNVFGLVLLGNVVTIGLLSAPTRFQVLFEGPPNEMIAGFPFVWLVSFVVPLAFLGHLLSIRQQLRVLRATRATRGEASAP